MLRPGTHIVRIRAELFTCFFLVRPPFPVELGCFGLITTRTFSHGLVVELSIGELALDEFLVFRKQQPQEIAAGFFRLLNVVADCVNTRRALCVRGVEALYDVAVRFVGVLQLLQLRTQRRLIAGLASCPVLGEQRVTNFPIGLI